MKSQCRSNFMFRPNDSKVLSFFIQSDSLVSLEILSPFPVFSIRMTLKFLVQLFFWQKCFATVSYTFWVPICNKLPLRKAATFGNVMLFVFHIYVINFRWGRPQRLEINLVFCVNYLETLNIYIYYDNNICLN